MWFSLKDIPVEIFFATDNNKMVLSLQFIFLVWDDLKLQRKIKTAFIN